MHLDDHSDIPFYQQLFDQLRADIEDGTRPAGAKLPSIRGLAGDLGCARNTVEQAYHLLTQEGYVESRPGSGYVVQNVAYLQPTAASPACAVLLGSPARRAMTASVNGRPVTFLTSSTIWRTEVPSPVPTLKASYLRSSRSRYLRAAMWASAKSETWM